MQEVRAKAPDEYDFARLVWQACALCRLGMIVKIRVTGPWQRHGYNSRMVRFALRGRDGYAWTTTPQSEDAQAFFPAFAFPPRYRFRGSAMEPPAFGSGMTSPLVAVDDPGGGVTGPGGIDGPLMRGLSTGLTRAGRALRNVGVAARCRGKAGRKRERRGPARDRHK